MSYVRPIRVDRQGIVFNVHELTDYPTLLNNPFHEACVTTGSMGLQTATRNTKK